MNKYVEFPDKMKLSRLCCSDCHRQLGFIYIPKNILTQKQQNEELTFSAWGHEDKYGKVIKYPVLCYECNDKRINEDGVS